MDEISTRLAELASFEPPPSDSWTTFTVPGSAAGRRISSALRELDTLDTRKEDEFLEEAKIPILSVKKANGDVTMIYMKNDVVKITDQLEGKCFCAGKFDC